MYELKNKRFENKNEQLKKNTIVIITIFIILMNTFVTCSAGDINVSEKEIIWGYSVNFETPTVYINGKVTLNFTNLLNSASTVRITRDPNSDNFCTWSPYIPQNFTIAPGESYIETFELLDYETETGGYVVFGCSVITEDSSATLRLESLVVKKGRELPGYLFATAILAVSFITIFIKVSKRKLKK